MRLEALDDLNAKLASWRGCSNALLWRYSATFRRLVLRLDHHDGMNSMQILALGCKCLSGPMDWSDASLQSRIAPEIDPRNGHTLFELTDEAVPFRLLCYELYATIDSWAALDASLDNFDIEGPTDDVGMPLSPR